MNSVARFTLVCMSFGDSMCAFLLIVLCMSAAAGSRGVCIDTRLANS